MRSPIVLERVCKSGLGTFLKFGCTGLVNSGLENAVFSGEKENKCGLQFSFNPDILITIINQVGICSFILSLGHNLLRNKRIYES